MTVLTKRVAAAAVLITAALLISLFSLRYVSSGTRELVSLLEQAQSERSSGGETIERAVELWNEKKTAFGILLKHADTDEIDRYFRKMAVCLEKGEAEALFDAAEDCRAALEVMLDGERPVLANIF